MKKFVSAMFSVFMVLFIACSGAESGGDGGSGGDSATELVLDSSAEFYPGDSYVWASFKVTSGKKYYVYCEDHRSHISSEEWGVGTFAFYHQDKETKFLNIASGLSSFSTRNPICAEVDETIYIKVGLSKGFNDGTEKVALSVGAMGDYVEGDSAKPIELTDGEWKDDSNSYANSLYCKFYSLDIVSGTKYAIQTCDYASNDNAESKTGIIVWNYFNPGDTFTSCVYSAMNGSYTDPFTFTASKSGKMILVVRSTKVGTYGIRFYKIE